MFSIIVLIKIKMYFVYQTLNMKVSFTILLFFIVVNCFSQKSVRVIVDKITGDTLLITGLDKLYSKASFSGTVGEQLKSAVSKSKSGIALTLWVQTAKSSIFSVDTGDKAIIKLENDEVITLNLLQDVVSDYSEISYGSKSMSHYILTEKDIKSLSSSDVKIIRIESSLGNLDYELKEKFKGTIKNQLSEMKL